MILIGALLVESDGCNTVLCRGVEHIVLVAIGNHSDVLFLQAILLDEDLLNVVGAVLRKFLVDLCSAGLFVGGTGDGNLAVCIKNVGSEVLEVSKLAVAEFCLADAEVQGDRCTSLHVGSYELTVLIDVGLTLGVVLLLLFHSSNLVLQGGVLALESRDLVLQLVVVILCERKRDDGGSDAAVTVEAVLVAEVISNTKGESEGELNITALLPQV